MSLALTRIFGLFPPSASRGAEQVDLIFLTMILFSAVITAVIALFILFFLIRYRAGSSASRAERAGNTTRVEVIWIVIPTLVFLVLFGWAGRAYLDQAIPPPDAAVIYVVGKQWMWKVQHPGGQREINELHVPVGRPVKIVLTSQDVIHSLFLPSFRLKQDALPGRYTSMWFEPTKAGVYPLLCAEYCGFGHSGMIGRLVVLEAEKYEGWLANAHAPAPGSPGMPEGPLLLPAEGAFFRFGCATCHLPSSAVRAPRLDGIFGRPVRLTSGETVVADANYIRESILEPQAKISAGYPTPSLMPTYQGVVTEDDLIELVEFIRSIRDGWTGEES